MQDEKNAVIVFAAASLQTALNAVIADWQRETGGEVKASYAASSALAKQLEQDAPAEIFISADLDWMNFASGKGLIKADSRINLLGNRLVLVAPKGSDTRIDVKSGFHLPLKDGQRLAMANVDAVPAGKYGKAALEKLGAWSEVKDHVAQAENVRAALLLVSRGEAPLGIVYQTDAASDPNVVIVGKFPEDSHPPIIYPAALTPKATAVGVSLFDFIKSDKAKPYFEAQGFTVLK